MLQRTHWALSSVVYKDFLRKVDSCTVSFDLSCSLIVGAGSVHLILINAYVLLLAPVRHAYCVFAVPCQIWTMCQLDMACV
jgi:hypothetical protein